MGNVSSIRATIEYITGLEISWFRVFAGLFSYYLLLLLALYAMLFYRLSYLLPSTQYICGNDVELACFVYVIEQLVTSSQWQALQFLVYLGLSFVLWPIFKNAKGSLWCHLSLVSALVSILMMLSIGTNGPELIASLVCPMFIALLLVRRRERLVVFNRDELGRA